MPPGREHGRLLANPAAGIQNGERVVAVSAVRQCRDMSGQVFLKDLQAKTPFQSVADLLAKATCEAVEISVHAVLGNGDFCYGVFYCWPGRNIDHASLFCVAVQQDIKEALIKS